MRTRPIALSLALTPLFLALPTVTFAAPDRPHPVTPRVASTAIRGVDATALRRVGAPTAGAARPEVLSRENTTARFTVAGVSWARVGAPASRDVTVRVRVREDAGWTAWEQLTTPDDGPEDSTPEAARARVGTAPLVTAGATAIQVRVDTVSGQTPPDLKVTTIDPGTSAADDNLTQAGPASSASAAAVQPAIISRLAWGADERLRGPTTYNSTVKAITIHHTAGTNDYTQATAAAQVRGIYAYDTQGLGWSDIAYNFLVDKWGRVYEGRAGSITSAVRGAHAMGFNTDTMGVSAIGNYETTSAPAAMVDSIAKVAGWKLSQYGVNPAGTATLTSAGGSGAKFAAGQVVTLDAVMAHQNTSYTLCPGKYLYPLMSSIRTKATAYAGAASTVPTPPLPPGPVTSTRLYATYGSLVLKSGSSGVAVRDLQLELNRRGFSVGTADGAFGPKSLAAVKAFQASATLAVTGQVAANDWKALSGLAYVKVTPPAPPKPPVPPKPPTPPAVTVRPGFTADGRGDVMGRTADGNLYLYAGGVGAFGAAVRVGSGWNVFRQVVSPGDWTGDGFSDVFAIKPSGELFLYRGNGKGGFLSGATLLARTWAPFTDLVTPGDWDGDKKADLLARKANGELWLVPGNGKGSFGYSRKIGTGWNMFAQLVTPGDVTGDGKADLLGRTASGKLYLYVGTGTGTGYQPGKVISSGWKNYPTVLSTGDATGDGKADLIGRTATGRTDIYAGTGKGAFATAPKTIKPPWGATTRIYGVR